MVVSSRVITTFSLVTRQSAVSRSLAALDDLVIPLHIDYGMTRILPLSTNIAVSPLMRLNCPRGSRLTPNRFGFSYDSQLSPVA